MNKYNCFLSPFKWFVLETFPFIEDTFDALNEYQLLCKIVELVNKTGFQVEKLTKYFNELKNYVYNYFDNLDVQEEINNKLNEMALSGELEDLLRNQRTATSNYVSQTYTKKTNSDIFDVDLSQYNTDDFYDLWDALETEFPNKIKSYTWGYDEFDNELKYYVITANSKKDCGLNANQLYQTDILENNLHSSPYMFFTSGIHGNEKLPIYHLYQAFSTYLHGNKSSDNFILDNYTYVILPCVNPSGIDDNTRNNRNGVNINRNFPTPNWSSQPDTDKGQEAGDQKETQFVVDVLSQYNMQKYKNGMVCIDWHSHQYYNHEDKRVLWFTINNYSFKQYILKQAESLKNMILNEFPELATDPTNPNEHFIHFVTGVTEANCAYYCHKQGYYEATAEVPDEFIQGDKYTRKGHKIAYLILTNTILQLTNFSGNMPRSRYNQLAQIGCDTSNTLIEVINAVPNNSTLVITLSNDSTLFNDMPIFKGNTVHGILSITKSPKYDSEVSRLTYTSYAYKQPKIWIASYNNNDRFYGWEQIAKSVYGNINEIDFETENTNPTIQEICEALPLSSIAVLRVSNTESNLYTQCNENLGILTIKKPRYTNVDCEIEFTTVTTDFMKMYNIYYRGTLRGWKQVTLTNLE